MALAVGIDVGGTKIAGGVVDEKGAILATARRVSPATDTEAIERNIEDLVDELRGDLRHRRGRDRRGGVRGLDPVDGAVRPQPRLA